MSALSDIREKDFDTWTRIEKCIVEVWEMQGLEWMAEAAADEFLTHRSELETAKAQVKWWLENYDITMPCGHKNRYLLTDGRGDIVRDVNGDCVCVMCRLENAAEIEAELKGM